MVGKGKVHNTLGEVLHHQPLPTGYLKVSIDISLEGGALLPILDNVSDATLLGEAIGAYVAWSSSLIRVDDETPTKPKSKDKGITRKTESVASKKEIHAKEIEQVSRGNKPEISNISTRKKVDAKKATASKKPISQEDMDQVFKHLQLGLGVIDIYIRFMYEKVMRSRGLEERFAFLSPNTINASVLQAFQSQRDIQVPKSRANNITWLRVQVIGADVKDRANKFIVVVF
ncbi:uncharacterized protein LOC131642420 [Vicia villosa]|uniref:uncharacterized protein LOC131642420 n=1 Tax=Vicia villosa TaxID=3911 RepID=UPI00273C9F43|nr:uncharacterized protein LOC131642420 [Vicia villosa]